MKILRSELCIYTIVMHKITMGMDGMIKKSTNRGKVYFRY